MNTDELKNGEIIIRRAERTMLSTKPGNTRQDFSRLSQPNGIQRNELNAQTAITQSINGAEKSEIRNLLS